MESRPKEIALYEERTILLKTAAAAAAVIFSFSGKSLRLDLLRNSPCVHLLKLVCFHFPWRFGGREREGKKRDKKVKKAKSREGACRNPITAKRSC